MGLPSTHVLCSTSFLVLAPLPVVWLVAADLEAFLVELEEYILFPRGVARFPSISILGIFPKAWYEYETGNDFVWMGCLWTRIHPGTWDRNRDREIER